MEHSEPGKAVAPFGFREDIQGLRALAVVVVVGYHADFVFRGGFAGVDMFFVISGFVITRLLLRELTSNQRVNFVVFYTRRARRLLPALGLVMTVTVLASAILAALSLHQTIVRTAIAAALFNANTYLITASDLGGYFEPGSESNPLLHTWSLSVEEQFYLVFPAIVGATWAVGRRARLNPTKSLGVVLALVLALSLLLELALSYDWLSIGANNEAVAFYSAPTRAWEFAVGALVAVHAPALARVGRAGSMPLGMLGLGLIATAVFGYSDATHFPGVAAVVPVMGTACLIVAGGTAGTSHITSLLSRPALQHIGNLSYSWYLWHWPAIVFTRAMWPTSSVGPVLAGVASLGLAQLTYSLLESRVRNWSPTLTRQTVAVGLISVGVVVVAAVGLEAAEPSLDTLERREFAHHAGTACQGSPDTVGTDEECAWKAEFAAGTITLIGDSNAGHFVEGFIAAASSANLDASLRFANACPLVDITIVNDGFEETACRELTLNSLSSLTANPRDVIVLAAASDQYIEDDRISFLSPDGLTIYRGSRAKADAWRDGLARVIETLDGSGSRVIVLHPVPRLDAPWAPSEIAPLLHLGPSSWMNQSVPRESAIRFRVRSIEAERQAGLPDTIFVDPFDEICPTATCSAFDGELWLYRDWAHISIAGSERLTGVLLDAMDLAVG